MDHEHYMRMAVDAARQAEKDGAVAIAAILVKDGKVISSGESTTWIQKDPSGHGEINCIRAACKELDTTDLTGCVMYGTLEPCGMCLSCAAWANLGALYFGAYRKDVAGNEYEIKGWNSEEAAKNMRLTNGGSIQVTGGILRDECAALLKEYKNWTKQ
ncbi:MAG TPA: nucleoside deaminase [Candidatus Paceibacterota bacterium]|nr:nucleoside deaminase [Candidatus Paceibacterota bacterium]